MECREYSGNQVRTHGMCDSPEYKSWTAFKKRGQLTKQWHRSFEEFLSVVGKRPEGTKLTRINTKKPLGPKNWKWSTGKREVPKSIKRKLLTRKSRQAVIIEARKAGVTLQGIGDALGLTKERVRQLESYGPKWTPGTNRGIRKKTVDRDKKIVKCYKDGLTVEEIADTLDFGYGTIKHRIAYLQKKRVIKYRIKRKRRPKRKK